MIFPLIHLFAYVINSCFIATVDGNIIFVDDRAGSYFDADGNVFYFVPASDLEDGSGDNPLTPEAVEKWKAKLGL